MSLGLEILEKVMRPMGGIMREASQFPRFSEGKLNSRHQRVKSLMSQRHRRLAFFGAGQFSTDIYWLSDWPGGRENYILFEYDSDPIVIAQLYNHIPMARVLSVIKDIRWAGANTAGTVSRILGERGLGGKRVGLIGGIPYRHYQRFKEENPDVVLLDFSSPFRMMRTIKSDEEIARLKLASQLTDKSMVSIQEGLKSWNAGG